MSNTLSKLLGAREPMFTFGLHRLERTTGQQGIDIQLTAEIRSTAQRKMRELGLDPKDTTGAELYAALISLVKIHDRFLLEAIGGNEKSSNSELFTLMERKLASLDVPRNGWFLKLTTAKRLLKAMPPRRLMKQLKYKSVDSMLKREKVVELFAGLRLVESPEWNQRFLETFKRLQPADFELRPIQTVLLQSPRWKGIAEDYVKTRRDNLLVLQELGALMILPLPVKRLAGLCITTMPLILYKLNEIRLTSTLVKFQQVKPNFGRILVRTLRQRRPAVAIVAGQDIHWSVIQRHFGRQSRANYPEIFEPHVQFDDLLWRQAEDVLYKIEPALSFWKNTDYIGYIDNQSTISFNLLDMAVSYCNLMTYRQHCAQYLQESLSQELICRYLKQDALNSSVLSQLDNQAASSSHNLSLDFELATHSQQFRYNKAYA